VAAKKSHGNIRGLDARVSEYNTTTKQWRTVVGHSDSSSSSSSPSLPPLPKLPYLLIGSVMHTPSNRLFNFTLPHQGDQQIKVAHPAAATAATTTGIWMMPSSSCVTYTYTYTYVSHNGHRIRYMGVSCQKC
jgi:hypothetical protein